MLKKSILTMNDLTIDDVNLILNDALLFSNSFKDWQLSRKRLIANLFFESSTRTHYSFNSAELQLGANIVDFNAERSSLNKGESLYDTVKTFKSLGYDAVVIRHEQDEYFKELENIDIHIINAGDGKGNHPSQSLLDLYTVYDEFNKFEDINLLIVGDIRHSRVAHSNMYIFEKLGANVKLSGPEELIEDENRFIDLDEGVKWADVVMLLRIQFERHKDQIGINRDEYLEKYGLTKDIYKMMKENAIIMHPAPVNRGLEIDTDLVEAPKSRIFKQMENGVLVRKAMLKYIFDEKF
ncbi:aspartate carbamoyltransferase catalytic subunit [Helcococcus kunzii]|uniref:aspartate carbamoyltransferase catalytic subunit n=1 Tax=Helcococcus kunzii TaxID=40091 RepID=UPI0021A4D4C9|nr:aspartate carbamoyltransferase catalytic subunit [Helcococcus kunzii]MCT1796765.1 aspartate carbamoyltransferase catalytic subunit [Helcococcus kunzii]MCT1988847.1 aspartate carbamoyltransferase catalytic subunit [Helcococcus kunzii]